MKLVINGEQRDLNAATVRELVIQLGMADKPMAVEVNKQVVPRKLHEKTPLQEGDKIEIVTLVGGG